MHSTTVKLFVSAFILTTIGVVVACTRTSLPPTPRPPGDTTIIIGGDTPSSVNLKQGLLLYLPFNGSIADSSGNNNPTYADGNGLTYHAHGYANSAFGGS